MLEFQKQEQVTDWIRKVQLAIEFESSVKLCMREGS